MVSKRTGWIGEEQNSMGENNGYDCICLLRDIHVYEMDPNGAIFFWTLLFHMIR